MLRSIEISGFKSFAKKTSLSFDTPVTAIVGPNGSGKSNVVEAIRFVLGEQSMKSLRGKGGTDLIWKGSKLLPAGSRAKVSIEFDNTDRKFAFGSSSGAERDIAFDTIVLSREVRSDGGSDYFINGTGVRLKDITELLGSVNIGASGHHIISQGEADRLLSANAKDRRGMVEEALGLKVYQTRIRDSERKLEKTLSNMKEVQSLRRELAPHLTFLGKQVEKIKMAEELRKEFATLFNTYSISESGSIAYYEEKISNDESRLRDELSKIEVVVSRAHSEEYESARGALLNDVREKEGKQYNLVRERDELGRAIGRIEGKLDALTLVPEKTGSKTVSGESVVSLCNDILSSIDSASGFEDISLVRESLASLRSKVKAFVVSIEGEKQEINNDDARKTIEEERVSLLAKLSNLDNEIQKIQLEISEIRTGLAKLDAEFREAERSSYEGVAKKATIEGQIRECVLRRENIIRRKQILEESKLEAEALVGIMFGSTDVIVKEEDTPEKSAEREMLHRKIERIKIKLEDAGAASGAEIVKEYEDTQARDQFLSRELVDLETSIASLRTLIADLRTTIERTFKEGIEKINAQFTEFFKQMFNGGSAFLSIVVEHRKTRDDESDVTDEDDLPFEHGIEINVTLPHKKVRDLNMLSGGERSLVSIALLFAMSQVNPPPFLVLDETDAALDEANSRRYGDMLDILSKHSKLIVVTHNRETMSRAQVLYGVTMGLDGASKLLSIKFDEAVQIAK